MGSNESMEPAGLLHYVLDRPVNQKAFIALPISLPRIQYRFVI